MREETTPSNPNDHARQADVGTRVVEAPTEGLAQLEALLRRVVAVES